MPDFELRVNNKKTSLQDYSGRWLILDFWAQSCRACFDTFPKANQMQLKFHDNLDWVLVGYTGGSLSWWAIQGEALVEGSRKFMIA